MELIFILCSYIPFHALGTGVYYGSLSLSVPRIQIGVCPTCENGGVACHRLVVAIVKQALLYFALMQLHHAFASTVA
jgi:hypothetical protein